MEEGGWAVPNTPVVRLQTDLLSANTDNKLQALVYDILSPATAITDYAIGQKQKEKKKKKKEKKRAK